MTLQQHLIKLQSISSLSNANRISLQILILFYFFITSMCILMVIKCITESSISIFFLACDIFSILCMILSQLLCRSHPTSFVFSVFVSLFGCSHFILSCPPPLPLPQECVTPEAQAAYNVLVEQPAQDTNPLRMLRSVPFVRPRVRGNKNFSTLPNNSQKFNSDSTFRSVHCQKNITQA